MSLELQHRISQAHQRLRAALIAETGDTAHWTGRLSSSALSTATAVTALATVDQAAHRDLIQRGLKWLATNINPDGGWGDTVRSQSNLSTTALVWAAFGAAKADSAFPAAVEKALAYIARAAGSPERLVPTIETLYGEDRTFSVPITMTLALSGRLGPDGWRQVRPLPFELAALPRRFFSAARLPVVSYALPALIAIGQVIHHHAPRFNPFRALTRARTLNVLSTLQPPNGGFLEATPLTSFVTMSLAAMEQRDDLVTRRGAEFLRNSVLPDGSWPIDTNLATWVTTLAIKALKHSPDALNEPHRDALRGWLLGQQWTVTHPYTGAAAGGWAWTDLPGGVPDADDTAGALLALHELARLSSKTDPRMHDAARKGLSWLLGVQNGDGGIPTFCRGWGTLPFDRSTPELTAHAIRAWVSWRLELPSAEQSRVERAALRGLAFLEKSQRSDGSWVPLWFGNESAPDHENPTYGTAQVLIALSEIRHTGLAIDSTRESSACDWMLHAQHSSGGWGGAPRVSPSVEETALALSALAGKPGAEDAVARGADWLIEATSGSEIPAAPIGLYFARLWYFERLYPLIFSVDALGRLSQQAR